MKKTFLLFLTLSIITFPSTTFSQDFSLKYGKITDDELKMKVYDKDTSAVAVVLYSNTDCYYDYNNGFKVIIEKRKKIKILKQAGTDEANVIIPYFQASSTYRDVIEGLEATAYNIENGSVEKSKLEKKYIFDEEIRKNYYRMKFTIPNVKVGSVIEYKYKIISDRYYDIPDEFLQEDIPIINTVYEVSAPEYFVYNVETRGYENISIDTKPKNQTFTINSSGQIFSVSCSTKDVAYSLKDVPALKDEPYVWDKDDFRSEVRYELSATNFPGEFYKTYSNTWSTIEKTLKDETDFVSNINKSSPYKDEVKPLIEKCTTDNEKIETVYMYIKKNIKWNNTYSFWYNDPREAEKKGTGTNAQINSVLIKTLKDMGFKAYPVLISLRSYGRLPLTYPSIDKLGTFIVGVDTSDGKSIYLDGSSKYGGINLLPTELLVDKGYVMGESTAGKWVDLTSLTRNVESIYINAKMDGDGKLQTKMVQTCTNLNAYDFKQKYFSAKDSMDYVKQFETKNNLSIDSLSIKGVDVLSTQSVATMVFTKDFEINGDYIYINPMLFLHIGENYFTQSDRKLPIEFNYPDIFSYYANIQIPEGYSIAELPKSTKIILGENQGKCTYIIGSNDNSIQLNYKFELNQIIFPTSDYQTIRNYFGQVATKNNEMVVLKKN